MDESLQNNNASLLQRYVDGELNAEEAVVLETRLREDEALRQELLNMQLAVQAIKHYGTSQKVTSIHQEMMEELKAKPKGKIASIPKLVRYSLAVAASILVIFIGLRLYLDPQTSAEDLYSEAFVDFNVSATRGNETSESTVEQQYQSKNYKRVINTVRSRHLSAKDSLLIGLSYLQTGKTSQAIGFFNAVAQGENYFRQDAEFYLSLSYLKEKNYKAALQWMRKINSNPAHLYYEQVDKSLIDKVASLNN